MSDIDPKALVSGWLADLQRNLGIRELLSLDQDGLCFIPYPNGLEIDVELPNGTQTVYIYTPVCHAANHSKEALMEQALALNMFQIQTRGGALAFDKATSDIMYCCSIEIKEYDSHKF